MTGIAANPQETTFQTAAFQVVFEFPLDILGQVRALSGQLGHESGIVPIYQLVEQRMFRAVAFVTVAALAHAGFRASRPVRHGRFPCVAVFLISLACAAAGVRSTFCSAAILNDGQKSAQPGADSRAGKESSGAILPTES
jgi:hypothetical protein